MIFVKKEKKHDTINFKKFVEYATFDDLPEEYRIKVALLNTVMDTLGDNGMRHANIENVGVGYNATAMGGYMAYTLWEEE